MKIKILELIRKKTNLSDKDSSRSSTTGDTSRLSSTHGLSTIHKRNLNLSVEGDDVEAAIRSVAGLMMAPGMKVVLKKSQSDKLGFRHIRLSQRYKRFTCGWRRVSSSISTIRMSFVRLTVNVLQTPKSR